MQNTDNQNNNELIERFLNEELSTAELAGFDKKVQSDTAFAKEVGKQVSLRQALQEQRKEEIIALTGQSKPYVEPPNNFSKYWRGLGLVLLIVAGYFGYQFWQQKQLESERKQELERVIQRERPNLEVAGNNWRLKIANGDYKAALNDLEAEIAQSSEPCFDKEIHYYSGILLCYVQENYALATKRLECALENSPNISLLKDVPIHLAYSLVHSGEIKGAQNLVFQQKIDPNILPESVRNQLIN